MPLPVELLEPSVENMKRAEEIEHSYLLDEVMQPSIKQQLIHGHIQCAGMLVLPVYPSLRHVSSLSY